MSAEPPPPTGLPAPGAAPTNATIVAPVGVRWGLPDAALLLALVPATLGLQLLYRMSGLPIAQPAPFIVSLGSYLVLLAAIVVISRRRGPGSLARDFGLRFRPVDLAIGLGIAIAGRVLGLIYAVAVTLVLGAPPRHSNVDFGSDPLWIVIDGVLVGSLLAPVVEELMMRGVLLRAIRNRIVRGPRSAPHPQPAGPGVQRRAIVASVLISSAVFMVLHLHEALDDLSLFVALALTTFTVGMLHAVITVVTGRLGPAIVSHVLINGSAVAIILATLKSS